MASPIVSSHDRSLSSDKWQHPSPGNLHNSPISLDLTPVSRGRRLSGRESRRRGSRRNSARSTTSDSHGDSNGAPLPSPTVTTPKSGSPSSWKVKSGQRIVRRVSAQATASAMVSVLEDECRRLVRADHARVLLVQAGKRLVHPSLPTGGAHAIKAGGIASAVCKQMEVQNLSTPEKDRRWVASVDSPHTSSNCAAYACIPVKYDTTDSRDPRQKTAAVLQVYRFDADEAFSTAECLALYRAASFVGNILHRSQSRIELEGSDASQKRVDDAMMLHATAFCQLAKVMASDLRLDVVIPKILTTVTQLLDADRCSLFLVCRKANQLILRKGSSRGRPKNFSNWVFGESNKHSRMFAKDQCKLVFPMNQGLAGHVASTGQTVRVRDAHQDNRFNRSLDRLTGYRTTSVLAVPVLDRSGNPIGVLEALNKNCIYDGFTSTDEVLITTCAAQTAVAILSSQLHEQMSGALTQASALLEMTRALSKERRISPLLSLVAKKTTIHLTCKYCTVFMVESTRKGKMLKTSSVWHWARRREGQNQPRAGKEGTYRYIPLGKGIVGTVAQEGKLIKTADAQGHSAYDRSVDMSGSRPPTSVMCAPISDKGHVVGVIYAENKLDAADGFSRYDEKLVKAFSAQAAVAIQNSQMLQQTERALNHALAGQRNLKFMKSIHMNMFRDLQTGSLALRLVDQAKQLLHADACTIYLADVKTRKFWVAADTRSDEQTPNPTNNQFEFGIGLAGMAADKQQLICIRKGASADPRFLRAVDCVHQLAELPDAYMVCPILSTGGEDEGDDDDGGCGGEGYSDESKSSSKSKRGKPARMASPGRAATPVKEAAEQSQGPKRALPSSPRSSSRCSRANSNATGGAVCVLGVLAVSMFQAEDGNEERTLWGESQEQLLHVFCTQAAEAIQRSKKVAHLADKSTLDAQRQQSAAEYLVKAGGMRLASDDIHGFAFSMRELELKALIGRGMYGDVFRAVLRNRVVAAKRVRVGRLTGEQIDAFCNEAALMCQLRHPNIVGFIGAVTEPSNLCIVMEYCARGSLTDVILEARLELSLERRIRFCLDAALGMLYLHSSNPVILHRDLKSDNLLVTDSWRIKVTDFGLTRFMNETKNRSTQVGTPMWMAPEVIRGREFTQKSDVYSFGIILWEIMERAEPYSGRDPMQVVVDVVNDDARPAISAQLRSSPLLPLIKACWDRDPNRRPSFDMVVQALQMVLSAVQKQAAHE